MKALTLLAGCCLIAGFCASAGVLPAPRVLTRLDLEDPHGRQGACSSCHSENAAPDASTWEDGSCVICHDEATHARLLHATGADPATLDLPAGWPLPQGRVSCITCHVMACQPEGRGVPVSLRGSPYVKLGAFCFRCHDPNQYKALYPHGPEQKLGPALVHDNPSLRNPLEAEVLRCATCHEGVVTRFGKLSLHVGDTRASGTELCRSCHQDRSHQYRHLGVTLWQNHRRPEAMGRLAAFQKEHKLRLPLLENQQIGCTTCHLPSRSCGEANWEGKPVSEESLLRVPKSRLCTVCHDEV